MCKESRLCKGDRAYIGLSWVDKSGRRAADLDGSTCIEIEKIAGIISLKVY